MRDVLGEGHRVQLGVPARRLGAVVEQRDVRARAHRLGEHRPDDERDADRLPGPLDLGGGVGVAERVDVGGVLGPDDEAEVVGGPLGEAARSRATWLSRTARRSALKSRPALRHVALDEADRDLAPVGGQGDERARPTAPRSATHARRRGPAPERRASPRPRASRPVPTTATARVTPGAPSQRASGSERAVGLAEREPGPREPAVRGRPARPLLRDPAERDEREGEHRVRPSARAAVPANPTTAHISAT